MDPSVSINIFLIILSLSILINSILIIAEISIFNFQHNNKLKKLYNQKINKNKYILEILQNKPTSYKSITIYSTISTIISSSISIIYFYYLSSTLINIYYNKIDKNIIIIISILFSIIISAILILTFSYNIPRIIALNKPTFFSLFCIKFLIIFKFIIYPIPMISNLISFIFSKLFKIDINKELYENKEEKILSMINDGNQNGSIEQTQKEMINKIFEFDDISAFDVMTHRTEIEAANINSNISEINNIAITKGFSRIPIYKDDIDNIIGVIYVKDLLPLIGAGNTDNVNIKKFIRNIIYVPESTKCKDLFKQLTIKKTHMAIVIDDFGGTSGLVTMEDLIESIFGNIQDEYDKEEEQIKKINKTTFDILGSTDIQTVSNALNIKISNYEDYDTIAGYLTDLLGRIPEHGEQPSIIAHNFKFTITLIEDRRISKIKATKLKDSIY